MDRRHIALGTLWLLLVLLSGCTAVDTEDFGSDALINALSANTDDDFPSRESVIITWVFRAEDCLTCQAFPIEIRKILDKHGAAVRFAAIQVGEAADTAIASAFFRRERLSPHYRQMERSGYRALFGDLPVPAIFVTINGRLALAEFGDNAGTISGIPLSEFISGLL